MGTFGTGCNRGWHSARVILPLEGMIIELGSSAGRRFKL